MKAVIGLAQGAALIVLATPGFAQITADDVWANQTAMIAATGLQLDGTLTRDGSVVTVTDYAVSYTLPMGFGSIYMQSDDLTLTENADGTVSLGVAPETVMALGGDINVEGDSLTFLVSFNVMQDGFVSTASGVPGDVTYVTTIDLTDMALDSVSMTPDPGLAEAEIAGFLTMQDLASTTQITVADDVTIRTSGTYGATIYEFSFDDGSMSAASFLGSAAMLASTSEIVLPGTPLDILNLAAALRDGLSVTGSSTSQQATSATVQELWGEVFSDQSQTMQATNQTMTLNQQGLSLTSSADGVAFEAGPDASVPFPLTVAMSHVGLTLSMPVMASAELQNVLLDLDLRDLTVSDDVWAMADQAGVLPRDPATLAFTLSGQVLNSVDLFDFMSLADLEGQIMAGEMPVELRSLALSGFEAAGVGVSATGEGAFTFDNTDLETFDGLPRPVGSGSIVANGVNALLDKLIAAGLIPSEEVMGMRMGIAMFAEATGDDQLTASVEMTPDGQIIVNGQRMQ